MDNAVNVVLGLGSNLGDRELFLNTAIEKLKSLGSVSLISKIYQTPAWGYEDSKPYLNQIVSIKTRLSPHEVARKIKGFERDAGRDVKSSSRAYEARTLDIDILFYNDLVLETEDLIIPHPRLHLRNFVLVPLVEVLPLLVHPLLNETSEQLLASCPDDAQIEEF